MFEMLKKKPEVGDIFTYKVKQYFFEDLSTLDSMGFTIKGYYDKNKQTIELTGLKSSKKNVVCTKESLVETTPVTVEPTIRQSKKLW